MTERETMARQRTTQFVATISWDEDSHFDDVRSISQLMEEAGYSTRMAADNSTMMVLRNE
jgi:mannitol/fructose-specific phosphotransferase system IIA component